MQVVKKNNPAGRLYHIFQEAQTTTEVETPMGQVWKRVMSINSNDPVILSELRRLVIHLIDDTEKLIRRKSGINHALFLASLPEIKTIMEESKIDTPWSQLAAILTEKALTELVFCADALDAMETPIPESELEEMANKIEAFAHKIKQAQSCDPEMKELFHSLVGVIRRGIRDYKIIGVIALQEALAVCIGRLFVMRSPGFAGETEMVLLSYIKDLLTQIDSSIGHALQNKSLYENVASLLPGAAVSVTRSAENGDSHWKHLPEEVSAIS